jgi:drug/metabolite transporter (DMT)-like permease
MLRLVVRILNIHVVQSAASVPLLFHSRGIAALLFASIFFASSAILIRFATEVSAIPLTFFRLSIAAVALILFASARRSLRFLARRDLALVVLSGTVLSLHFATFIFAVKETTIANATFLVNTSPVILAFLSPLALRERTTFREAVGVAVATLGILLIANAGNGFRSFGLADLSALLAAFFVAIYSLAGRFLRTRGVSTACYTSYAYSTAALVALVMVVSLGTNPIRPYDIQNILAILLLALLPTAVGHSLYNYALGSVRTVTAVLFALMEPILASIFAVPLFGEIPTFVEVLGYCLILIAVTIVATNTRLVLPSKS